MLSNTQIGRAAEFLVCYTLQLNGIECYHVNSTTDVIATVASGKLLRVEVKSATTPALRKNDNAYRFHISKTDNADWYALVALDTGLMIFMSRTQVKTRDVKTRTITVRASRFTAELQADTIQKLGAET